MFQTSKVLIQIDNMHFNKVVKGSLQFIFLLVLFLYGNNIKAQNFNQDLQKLQLAYKLISTFYVDSVDNEKLVEDAIVGMLKNLDPHSEYLSQEEVRKLNEPLEGGFEGVGVQFNILNDTLLVVAPISGGPSEKVGILAGDRIIYIDDENVAGIGLTNSGVQQRLKGKKGTKVKLKILRKGAAKLLDFTVERDKIPIYSVEASYMASDDVGYIKISQFSATTAIEFAKSLKELNKRGMKNLILDLRGNPGGYLKAAIEVVNEFLDGDKLIVYTEGVTNPRREYHSSSEGLFKKGKVAVLINEGSASASEIVTGAIQDWDRGIVLGRRSFGKGLVQRPLNLQDGSMIKLTIAKYYTPSGRCIQKPYDKGVDAYRREIYMRDVLHQESDSISHTGPEYHTKSSQRLVYGGGGINPDIFIAADTTGYSDYYRDLIALGVINRFILSYMDKNRDILKEKYSTYEYFNKSFVIDDKMIVELLEEGKKNEIKSDIKELEVSMHLLKNQLKALIARNIWGVNEYFQTINPNSNEFNKALDILSSDKSYSNLLN